MLLKENVITVNLPRSLIFPLPFTCALAFVENLFSLLIMEPLNRMKARAVSGEYLNYFTIKIVWGETIVIFDSFLPMVPSFSVMQSCKPYSTLPFEMYSH